MELEYFTLFSAEHILSLICYTALAFILIFVSQIFARKRFAITVSTIIFIIKIAELTVRHLVYGETFLQLLPIHLCNITFVLAILEMINPSKKIFQILFYWGLGAVAALLFPDSKLSFPNFVGISFFLTHFFILFVVWYQMIIFKYRPKVSGIFASFVGINILAVVVFKINEILGTNYMYINYKPAFDSPLNYFGPWPNYILVGEIIFLVLSFLCYLPFRKKNFKYSSSYYR